MKENLVSFKLVSAVVLAGVALSFTAPAHAAPAPAPARPFSLLYPSDRTPSGESVFRGTLVEMDGRTAISSIDRKWDAAVGIGTVNEAAVTPDGQVASRDANFERKPDGTLLARGTMTDFDGNSVNYTETLTRTAQGYIARGTTVGLAGATSRYETTVALTGRGAFRRTTVTTNSDGTTSTRTETLKTSRS